MIVIPTILTDKRTDLEKKLAFLVGRSQDVQIDVTDGKFAGNKSFPLLWLVEHPNKNMSYDIHLMVENPFAWVAECRSVMAERVCGQVEKMGSQGDFIERVESENMNSGLALDLDTPLSVLDQEALCQVSLVLLLAVKAGFSGQKFNTSVLDKLEELCVLREKLGLNFQIGIDGGINRENIGFLQDKADIGYVSSALWNSSDWEKSWTLLLAAVKSTQSGG